MNPDKFLTDLAALTGAHRVEIGFVKNEFEEWFSIELIRGYRHSFGTGPTVEAAMQEARAKLAAHYEGEPA